MTTERFDLLEQRVLDLEAEIAEIRGHAPPRLSAVPTPPAMPAAPAPRPAPARTRTHSPPPIRQEPRVRLTLEDVLSPRNLAIAGAAAVFIGLAFLVSYGISNGWIDETVRVIGAAVFSILLAGAGLYFQERKQQGTPAQALVVAGAAGLFLALVAATRLYGLVEPVPALAMAGLIGAFGVFIGLRWNSEVVITTILTGSLVSPLMLDATYSVDLLIFLIPVFAVAVVASVLRPWQANFTVTATVFLVSVIACVLDAQGGNVFAAFGLSVLTLLLCVAGSIGHLFHDRTSVESHRSIIYGIFVSAATVLGMALISGSDELVVSDWAAAWLILAAGTGGAVWWFALATGRKTLAVTAFSLATASAAAAIGFLFDGGPALSIAWSAQATCLIVFGRTDWQRWLGYAVLALAALVVWLEVPLNLLVDGSGELLKDLGVALPLVVPFAAMAWRSRSPEREVGIVAAVGVGAYSGMITVGALLTPESFVNLVPLALAGCLPIVVLREQWTIYPFCAFGLGAIVFSLLTSIPPDALIDGVPAAGAALATAAILVAMPAAVFLRGPVEWRQAALWTALGLCLYFVSVMIIDGFQGTAATDGGLPGTAQGQVIVSSLWALSGLALIVTGLRRGRPNWRKAGLILLILSMAKIILYDLSSLSSAGRMISFILVGLVLLAAAFAYQMLTRQEQGAN